MKLPSKTYIKVRETKSNKFTINEIFEAEPSFKEAQKLIYMIDKVEKVGEEEGWIIFDVKMRIKKI